MNEPELYLGRPYGPDANREHQAHQLDRFITLSGIGEHLATEESRLAFLQSLDVDQFTSILTRINGIVLNLPPASRHLADDLQVTANLERGIQTDVMPSPEDKTQLLGTALRIAQGTNNITVAALILGYGINAIHPFEDGNGRTARTVYWLMTRNYEPGSDYLKDLLAEDGDSRICLDASVFQPATYSLLQTKLGTHTTSVNLGVAKNKPKLQPILKDHEFDFSNVKPTRREQNEDLNKELATIFRDENLAAMLPYILINKDKSRAARNACETLKGITFFCVDEFITNASDQDIDKLMSAFRFVKRSYVEMMLNSIPGNENKGSVIGAMTEHGQVIHSWLEMGLLVTEGAITIQPVS